MRSFIFILCLILIFVSEIHSDLNDQEVEEYFYLSDEDPHDAADQFFRSTVQGTITDSNNVPFPDVHVLLLGNNNVISTYTDENGNYEFTGVATGTSYTILPCKYEEMEEVIDNSIVSGDDIITIAQGELGNTDGASPGNYHGHGGGWCSEFVSWSYWQAGDPFTGGVTDGGACYQFWNMSTVHRVNAGFGRNANWQVMSIQEIDNNWQENEDNPLEPQPGDYVFFSNTDGIDRGHSGIVREIDGTTMLTTEGNVSNLVQDVSRANWRTDHEGNTIVKGIGYRRIVSNIGFEPRSWYGYIYSDLDADFTIYSHELMTPANIEIIYDNNEIEISWDEVINADSYRIYSCADPFGEFTIDEDGSFDGTSWTKNINGDISFFFYVKAVK